MWGCEWFCAGKQDERWTKDANKAIHFPSADAAEEMWGWLFLIRRQPTPKFPYEQEGAGDWTYKYDLTEHMFIDEQPPSQEGVGQGDIAQGAAPLEPVAYRRWNNPSAVGGHWVYSEYKLGRYDEPLYALPPGYAVVPVEQGTDPYGTDSEGWSKNPNHWANKEKP